MNIYFSTWTHIFSDLHSDLIWVGAETMPGLRLRDGQVSDFLDLSISWLVPDGNFMLVVPVIPSSGNYQYW